MQLSNEEIMERLQGGFAPFRCIVELKDYHDKIGFRVYSDANLILGTFEGNRTDDLRDPAATDRLIADTRFFLEQRRNVRFASK